MVNDPIADLLTRIKNATQRNTKEIRVPSSKLLKSIVQIIKENEFIDDVEEVEEEGQLQPELIIKLKYINGKSLIQHVERVSKPGIRRYVSYKDIKPVLGGLGIGIISTSKGIMADKQAFTEKIGGEYLCKIW